MRHLIPCIVILLLCAVAVNGEEFFLDEDIILGNDGTAYIKGQTNIDILTVVGVKDNVVDGHTQELTLKDGLLWRFVYESEEELTEYKVDLFLPEFAVIQYVESNGKAGLQAMENRHLISFSGENQPLKIDVGYVVAGKRAKKSHSWIYGLVGAILVVLAAYFLIRKKSKKPKKEEKKTDKEFNEEKIKAIKLTLNENQLKILEALIEKKGEASQTTLKHLTGVPKSSLSRNLELMAQKNIIAKHYGGTSNYVKIHPSLYK